MKQKGINLEKAIMTLQHILEEAANDQPECKLACAIIKQTITDIFIDHKLYKINPEQHGNYLKEQQKAFTWIKSSPDFKIICDLALLNEIWVRKLIENAYDKYLEYLNKLL